MKGVSACTPTSSNFLSCTDLESFAESLLIKTVLGSPCTVNMLTTFRSRRGVIVIDNSNSNSNRWSSISISN